MGDALHALRRTPQIVVAVVIIKSVNGGLDAVLAAVGAIIIGQSSGVMQLFRVRDLGCAR
jgi:hypothetical protein